jgi:hypothetical protein
MFCFIFSLSILFYNNFSISDYMQTNINRIQDTGNIVSIFYMQNNHKIISNSVSEILSGFSYLNQLKANKAN